MTLAALEEPSKAVSKSCLVLHVDSSDITRMRERLLFEGLHLDLTNVVRANLAGR